MKYRKITAALAALIMMTSAFSCGKTTSDSSSGDTAGTKASTTAASGTAAASTEASSESKTTTSSATTGKNSKSTTEAATQASSGGEKSTQATTAASGAENTTAATKSGGSETTTASQSGDDEEKTYTAEVTLGSTPKVTGENVTVDGSKVTITAGGNYIFTGKVDDGQICVKTATEEKVMVILNGVDITCNFGPAILIDEAKKCTVKVKEGTVNNLSDSAKDKVYDGVIFSNDTLRLKGNGTLNITAGNRHGIASDDDIIIENGTYNIVSKKSGILAHDDVTVNGGNLNVKGGTNGIKATKGSININGGVMYISGGTKEEKSAVYAATFLNYTDGLLFAAGNQVTVPSSSATPYIVGIISGGTASADNEVKFLLNGKEAGSLTPHNNFKYVMFLSPEISTGDKFSITIGGKDMGEYEVESNKNEFSLK